MTNFKEARVKLKNKQLNKLKFAAKIKIGTTLRITKERFQDEELPHELFLIIRQTTKIKNAFANSMSTDIKLSTKLVQTFKLIQSGGFLGSWLGKTIGKLGKKN